jgi:hypothetical protein
MGYRIAIPMRYKPVAKTAALAANRRTQSEARLEKFCLTKHFTERSIPSRRAPHTAGTG